ncbi:HNH endonuclease [Streptomyces blattellae]|uniref:HNH endonuclease n=1 Tax=Streptomyces blattellae TaxID=2569855 RepID=UPI0018ACF7E3|nr:HNH endonuclease signature motif containing protein [Streptomyces blattellae]
MAQALSPEARERQRLYWQEKNRRRRAAKRGGASEPYTLVEIAARDRARCGLCGGRVAMKRVAPHPKAPTIDHVVPVAEGGDDTRANVQLAHFRCNSAKGARGSQQLALIG